MTKRKVGRSKGARARGPYTHADAHNEIILRLQADFEWPAVQAIAVARFLGGLGGCWGWDARRLGHNLVAIYDAIEHRNARQKP